MNLRVTFNGRLRAVSGVLDDEARQALNDAMAEMHKLGTKDPAIHLDASDGSVMITCGVEVDDLDNAVPPASGNIRSALHAAGIGTAHWPGVDDPRWTVEFIETRAEVLVPA